MSILFTQHMMPDGHKKSVEIDRPTEIEAVARTLITDGCSFEIEMLSTGWISMTCECGDEVLSHFICPNGPDVPLTVDRLVKAARSTKVVV